MEKVDDCAARAALAVRTNWCGYRSTRAPGKEANGRRKDDCSSEAEHANGMQTSWGRQGDKAMGTRLCWGVRT